MDNLHRWTELLSGRAPDETRALDCVLLGALLAVVTPEQFQTAADIALLYVAREEEDNGKAA